MGSSRPAIAKRSTSYLSEEAAQRAFEDYEGFSGVEEIEFAGMLQSTN